MPAEALSHPHASTCRMRYTEIDRRIDVLAGKQYGAFSRRQAYEAGASERFVVRRAAENEWFRPVRGVFVLTRSAGTWMRQCKIAELSVEGSAIAGHSALVLHAVPNFRSGPIELWTPITARFRHRIATIHRHAAAELTVVDGIRVTTVAQSLIDDAMSLSPWTVERALDNCILGKKVTVDDVDERLSFYEGSRRPGLPKIRPLIKNAANTAGRRRRASWRRCCSRYWRGFRVARASSGRRRCRGEPRRAFGLTLCSRTTTSSSRPTGAAGIPGSRTSIGTNGEPTRRSPTGIASCTSRGCTSTTSPTIPSTSSNGRFVLLPLRDVPPVRPGVTVPSRCVAPVRRRPDRCDRA